MGWISGRCGVIKLITGFKEMHVKTLIFALLLLPSLLHLSIW